MSISVCGGAFFLISPIYPVIKREVIPLTLVPLSLVSGQRRTVEITGGGETENCLSGLAIWMERIWRIIQAAIYGHMEMRM